MNNVQIIRSFICKTHFIIFFKIKYIFIMSLKDTGKLVIQVICDTTAHCIYICMILMVSVALIKIKR